jgi:predicted DNA binding CopG/RHH family protein
MSDDQRYEELLEQDWGDAWQSLSPAPPLVLAQPKSAQLTLRVPAEMVTALKEVARQKALPYHALARSWIAEGLRKRLVPSGSEEVADLGAPGDTQLNVKLSPALLDDLKTFSDEIRRPYHRLARLWLDAGLREELSSVTLAPSKQRPSLRELMILLLATPSPRTGDVAVRGITRLQKLLFVIEKQLAPDPSRFYAYNYGPFDEQVNDTADALEVKGLVAGSGRSKDTPPSVDDMMASVLRHAGPREDEPRVYVLTAEGQTAAEQLRRSNEAYTRLAERIRQLREEWDKPDLIERVYEAFPEYASRSVIKEKVARRAAARKRRPSG